MLQLFLICFHNLYTRSEYQDYLDILESVVRAVSLAEQIRIPQADGTVVAIFVLRAFALSNSSPWLGAESA